MEDLARERKGGVAMILARPKTSLSAKCAPSRTSPKINWWIVPS